MATRKQKLQVFGFLFVSIMLVFLIVYFVSGMYSDYGVRYWIEFDESILGVYEGGVVVYLGVPVGKVEEITVNELGKPKVIINIDTSKVKLYEGVEANLVIYSLAAGTMAISLSGGDPKRPELPPGSKIPARISMISSVSLQVEELMGNLKQILNSIKKGLEGLESGDITELTKKVDRIFEKGEKLLDEFDKTVLRINEVINTFEPKLTSAFQSVENTLNTISDTSRKADKLFTTLDNKIGEIEVSEIQRRLNNNLDEIRQLSENMNSLVRELKEITTSLSYKTDNVEYSLSKTFSEINRTLESIRIFIEALQNNPSSIIRGKTAPKREE